VGSDTGVTGSSIRLGYAKGGCKRSEGRRSSEGEVGTVRNERFSSCIQYENVMSGVRRSSRLSYSAT